MSKIASVEDVKAKLVIDLKDFVGNEGDVIEKPDFLELVSEEFSLEINILDMEEVKHEIKTGGENALFNEEDFSQEELDSAYVVEYTKRNFYTNIELFESFTANSYAETLEGLKRLI